MSPSKPMHPCNHSGCLRITSERFCPEHQRQQEKLYDQARGTSAERGYGTNHRRWRQLILARDPICMVCHVKQSTEADHIDGNNKNLDMDNGQGLCKRCHSQKTAQEQARWGK